MTEGYERNGEEEGKKERRTKRERQLEIKSVKLKSWSICFLFRLRGPEISRTPAAKEAIPPAAAAVQEAQICDYDYPAIITDQTGFKMMSYY